MYRKAIAAAAAAAAVTVTAFFYLSIFHKVINGGLLLGIKYLYLI